MPRKKKAPELSFQQHLAEYLVREHQYGVLEQADITDTEHFIAEGHLWAFLKATQADTLKKLADDYGTDARDEVFKALRKELEHTPLWMLLRHGLKVRGLELRLFYPKPRSAASAAAEKYEQNRITFRPHFYFGAAIPGEKQWEIDFVFFLNGLPIVALEVKHEANENVHDAVAQFAARLYYLRATARFGWTRNVLLNQIKAGAYERAVTESKSHNFPLALPEHAGKMDFYLNLLNDKERGDGDQPSIGIILCAEKDDVEVEYALRTKRNPIGVAVYQLQSKLPADLKGKLPTAKQLADVVRAVLPERKAP